MTSDVKRDPDTELTSLSCIMKVKCMLGWITSQDQRKIVLRKIWSRRSNEKIHISTIFSRIGNVFQNSRKEKNTGAVIFHHPYNKNLYRISLKICKDITVHLFH